MLRCFEWPCRLHQTLTLFAAPSFTAQSIYRSFYRLVLDSFVVGLLLHRSSHCLSLNPQQSSSVDVPNYQESNLPTARFFYSSILLRLLDRSSLCLSLLLDPPVARSIYGPLLLDPSTYRSILYSLLDLLQLFLWLFYSYRSQCSRCSMLDALVYAQAFVYGTILSSPCLRLNLYSLILRSKRCNQNRLAILFDLRIEFYLLIVGPT